MKAMTENERRDRILSSLITLFVLVERIRSIKKALNQYGILPYFDDHVKHVSFRLQECLKSAKDKAIIKNVKEDYFRLCKMYPEKNHEEIKTYISQLCRIKIQDKNIFDYLFNCCHYIMCLHGINDSAKTKDSIKTYEECERVLLMTGYEAVGYWTAKLEDMKQGKKNAMKRTDKKEARKAELRKWIAAGMKPAEYRLKAQQEFEVTDRTVLNWLKEIKDEKTSVLRKNNGIA